MTAVRILAGAALLVGGLAFGTLSESVAQDDAGIEVQVDNHSFLDMHVYVVQLGQRRTLGLVPALSKQSFNVPRPVAESDRDFQILAHPISGRTSFATENIVASGGDQVVVTLENNLNLSTVVVRDQLPPEEEAPAEPEPEDTQTG